MSLDKSLKSKDLLERHRNVLTRAERIQRLKDHGRWTDDMNVLGLPKVEHRKAAVGKKDKQEKEPDQKTKGDAKAPAEEKK